MTYESVKNTLNNNNNTHNAPASSSPISRTAALIHSLPNPIMHAIASSSAEIVACLMLTPAEVLKQNAQVINSSNADSPSKRGALKTVMSRFRNRPWRLWSGYTALVGRNLPFTGLQFPIFEYVRGRAVEGRRERSAAGTSAGIGSWGPVVERASLTGLSAAVSGTIASIVTTPIDVVKTRMMLAASDGSGQAQSQARQEKKKGTMAVGKEIFRDDGVNGLFRGGMIRAAWTAVSLAMYLSIYEGSRFYLENRRKEREGLSLDSEGA